MKRWKRLGTATLGIVMLLGVASAQQAPVTISVTWWGSQDRHDRTVEVIKMFEAEHPNIKVDYEFSGWPDYWTRVSTQAAGGQVACVMQQDYAYLGEWQTRGLLAPLDPYLKSGTIDTTNIPDVFLEGGRLNGKVYGISLGTNSQTFIVDVDLVKQAGLELPAPDWTWADFETFATALHKNLGIWAIDAGLTDQALWKSLLIGEGEWAFNDAGTALGYENDQPVIDYFNMLLRLQNAGVIPSAQQAVELRNVNLEQSPIVTKQAAMNYAWSNQVVALQTAAGADRNLALLTLPRPKGGRSENYLKPSMFFSLTSQCKNPEEAAVFINYFLNNKKANDVLFAERGVPISTDVAAYLKPKLDKASALTFDYIATLTKNSSPVPPADPPGWSDVLNNVYTPLFVDPVLFGQITPEQGAQVLRNEANPILARSSQ